MRISIILGVFLFIVSSDLLGQLSLEQIDLGQIKQKKIRSCLSVENQNNIQFLSDFRPSCIDCKVSDGFNEMENSYIIKQDPEKVWNTYVETSIAESWNGRRVSFGILFSKWTDLICYRDEEETTKVDTGQVFFINLKLLKGIYNIPVGVEIIDINEVNYTLRFSYLDGGKSAGEQMIKLLPAENGYTQIIHQSAFKSKSKFRDKFLYPYYHTRVLNEFHRNMAKKIISHRKEFIIN